MAGRFFWASTSDFIGRKATYFCFFALGAVLYFLLPFTRQDMLNSVPLFVGIAAVVHLACTAEALPPSRPT